MTELLPNKRIQITHSRSSIKRIGAALDADERRRNEDKFHHQFNYSVTQ